MCACDMAVCACDMEENADMAKGADMEEYADMTECADMDESADMTKYADKAKCNNGGVMTEYDDSDRVEGIVNVKAGYADSDKYGDIADEYSYRAGCAMSVPDGIKWSEYQQRKCISEEVKI